MDNHFCKSLNWKEQIESYQAFHKTKANCYSHYVGIPLIVFSLYCSLSWFRFFPINIPLSAATLFFISSFVFYYQLHKKLALAIAAWTCPLFLIAEEVALMPFQYSALIVVVALVVGWFFQLIGHKIEGNRPAFLTGLSHLWKGPLFITYEWLSVLGAKF